MREKPSHEVYIDGFYIDVTEVTNNQFQKFVNETGYLTIAEREIDWGEMKKSLPAGTPKPCLLYTSPSPRDRSLSRMPSSA